jgi:hypothetical protein
VTPPNSALHEFGGLDAPKHDNTENNLAELIARIQATVEWLKTVPTQAIEGQRQNKSPFRLGKTKPAPCWPEDYLKSWALPNVFFHTTTAYAICATTAWRYGKISNT